jgi:endonuclease G
MKNPPIRLLLAGLILLISSVIATPPTSFSINNGGGALVPQASESLHLTLGNPTGATRSFDHMDNFLLVKPQFALSFNNSKGGPNWVSWHLKRSDIGGQSRGDFHTDDGLPERFKHITKADYTGSGFDRGHLCNSKDRTNTRLNNDATFNMTNILPQTADNNRGPWVKLETYSRTLVDGDTKELYIVAGAFGSSGEIANGQVNVPTVFWKVIVVLPKGNADVSRINNTTRTIAVCMPNVNGIRSDSWRKYVTTIRNVEAATGYDFLTVVASRIQDAIETRRDSMGTGPASKNPCQP